MVKLVGPLGLVRQFALFKTRGTLLIWAVSMGPVTVTLLVSPSGNRVRVVGRRCRGIVIIRVVVTMVGTLFEGTGGRETNYRFYCRRSRRLQLLQGSFFITIICRLGRPRSVIVRKRLLIFPQGSGVFGNTIM